MSNVIESRYFYSLNYTLVLHFKEGERVEGELSPIDEYNLSTYTFTGLQCCEQGCTRIAFFLDWSFMGDPNWTVTSFICELVNKEVAILDWLLITNDLSSNPCRGTEFLYSEELFSRRMITPSVGVPFPLTIREHEIEIPEDYALGLTDNRYKFENRPIEMDYAYKRGKAKSKVQFEP